MHRQGREAALKAYGIKTAGITLGGVAQGARNLLIGNPGTWNTLATQARSGGLTEEGGLYHKPFDWLVPKIQMAHRHAPIHEKALALVNSGLSVAQPLMLAHSGYQALTGPEGTRGQNTGGLIGGLLGGTLGSPFGIVGNMAGSVAGSMIGGGVGHLADRAFGASPEETPQVSSAPF